ncbi:MAG: DODA-type extradiol aromatic ring-opening family dioxygenase [Gammaproteobacteria bacterium]
MPKQYPALFISHGAPDLILHASPAREFLTGLGSKIGQPRAIVVASAHYDQGPAPHITGCPTPRTIHDFGGFDPRLYQMRYRAPGAPALAAEMVERFKLRGLTATLDTTWGLDHGAWIPLMLMYPEATIPVLELSISGTAGPLYHLELGRAITDLRSEEILLIGSGGFTHNLSRMAPPRDNTAAPAWATRFAGWTTERLLEGDEAALLDYRARAPNARENHPSDEHFMPLYVVMGAAGAGWHAEQLHTSVTYGSVRMDSFAFN